MEFLYLIIAIVAGFLYPIYGFLTAKIARQKIESGEINLISAYIQTMFFLLFFTCCIILALVLNNDSFENIGLSFLQNPVLVAALILVTGIFLFFIRRMHIPDHQVEKKKVNNREIEFFLPKTQQEYSYGIVLSFVAGTTEEIIFRGFFYWQLSEFMHPILAVFIANFMFSLAHAITKLKNATAAFLLGLLFSASFLLTGSLWLAIAAHIMVDLYAMTEAIKIYDRPENTEELI